MTTYRKAALVIFIATIIISGAIFIRSAVRIFDEAVDDKQAIAAFCRETKTGARASLTALQNKDPELQRQAVKWIAEDRVHFGDTSARFCLKNRMPNPDAWSACLTFNDVPCVIARTEQLYKLLASDKE